MKNGLKKKYFIDLQEGERAVAQIAGKIYSAYIQTNKVSEGEEIEKIKKSVSEAIQIAYYVENMASEVAIEE